MNSLHVLFIHVILHHSLTCSEDHVKVAQNVPCVQGLTAVVPTTPWMSLNENKNIPLHDHISHIDLGQAITLPDNILARVGPDTSEVEGCERRQV